MAGDRATLIRIDRQHILCQPDRPDD